MEVDQQSCAQATSEFPMQGILSEVTTLCQPYLDKLFDSDRNLMLEGLVQIKNFVIGNNKQKSNFIALGVIPRLKYLIQQEESDVLLKTHCAVILGSLAKGIDDDVTNVWDREILDVLFNGLRQFDLKLYEACIRCIRTIVTLPEKQEMMFIDHSIFTVLLESINLSMIVQECTCEILMNCFKTEHHQNLLNRMNAIEHLSGLLTSSISRVKIKALKAICAMCHENPNVCHSLLSAKSNDIAVVELLTGMLSRAQPVEIQLYAAKVLTYVYRSGLQGLDKSVVCKKVLPCLVRMCDSRRNIDERISGAIAIACLIEPEPELQRIALICEQFPQKLISYFSKPTAGDTNNAADMKRFNYELSRIDDMQEAVFLAYSSLLSNDEDMRDLVVTESLVRHVIQGLESTVKRVRVAALLCLLSLSRSVQILRTYFEDHEVWKRVLRILQREESNSTPDQELVTASALLCNLLLDFSPCKWKLIDAKVLDMLKAWCRNETSINLKRNGIWGFFNATFQASEELKLKVMWLLDPDTLFMLLTCSDYEIIIKTLGVLKNILANAEHVDNIMASHGDTIMQACAVAIESTSSSPDDIITSVRIHTHALCVLACVAAGDETQTVQKYLHDNNNFMMKLIEYLASSNEELQRAAINCLWELCCGSESTVTDRRNKLKELGVVEVLQRLNADSASEKIKESLVLLQP